MSSNEGIGRGMQWLQSPSKLSVWVQRWPFSSKPVAEMEAMAGKLCPPPLIRAKRYLSQMPRACILRGDAKRGRGVLQYVRSPWDKHPCTDVSKPYSPFNAAGKPKLRNRRSEFERNGWLPLFIRHVEVLVIGALVHAVTLDDPTVLHFGLATEVRIDTERPIYFRRSDPASATAEVSFFPKDSSLPVTLEALVPCPTEMELRIHLSSV